MNSKHDDYPIIDIDEAILILDDLIGGGDEDRQRDSRISDVIRLLRHLKAQDAAKAPITDWCPPRFDPSD